MNESQIELCARFPVNSESPEIVLKLVEGPPADQIMRAVGRPLVGCEYHRDEDVGAWITTLRFGPAEQLVPVPSDGRFSDR